MTKKQYIKCFNRLNCYISDYVCNTLDMVISDYETSMNFKKFFGQQDKVFWEGLRYVDRNIFICWEESRQARLMLLTMFYVLGDKNIYGED